MGATAATAAGAVMTQCVNSGKTGGTAPTPWPPRWRVPRGGHNTPNSFIYFFLFLPETIKCECLYAYSYILGLYVLAYIPRTSICANRSFH
jgi:hypothetical protein